MESVKLTNKEFEHAFCCWIRWRIKQLFSYVFLPIRNFTEWRHKRRVIKNQAKTVNTFQDTLKRAMEKKNEG